MLPARIHIHEEGPREGFQFEPGPISTARKVELIDALSLSGLQEIQVASFVNPKRVPGWADAEGVARSVRKADGVRYTCLWLNQQGFERAQGVEGLFLKGNIQTAASEPFLIRNQNQDFARNCEVQRDSLKRYVACGIQYFRGSVMAAFGCNFAGEVSISDVLAAVARIQQIARDGGVRLDTLSLADTMAWATPTSIKKVVGAVRSRWPEQHITLHLHDTRGLGIANALAGLELGVDTFDSSIAGLGGCPFAGHAGAAGNVCTEDLVFMCEEMGIATGTDLDRLIACARLAEDIVGHPLPGAVMRGGGLQRLRRAAEAARAG